MVGTVTLAVAQDSKNSPQPHSGPAETGLLGISLYDPGLKVIKKFGSPDQIIGLATSGQAVGGAPSGGGAPGRGGPGAAGGGAPFKGGAGGRGGAPASVEADYDRPGPLGASVIGDPFGDADTFLQGRPPGMPGVPAGFGPPPGAGQGGPTSGGPPNGQFGAPPGANKGRGGAAGGGAPSLGGGASSGGAGTRVFFTRWVYKRDNSRYAFVLDKFNRVVQIEAIALSNPKVKTKRGLGFGSTFAQLIQKHNAPDGYEISGDSLVVRYLVRDHVAFRLSRITPNKPQRVTGIVVAAGKA
ncbi:MAG: hypothetical protein KF857_09065 [Fimbriimonadaceae bacterium]|nr:hypothetical protein [Fimbriimonadaceae bacterium]